MQNVFSFENSQECWEGLNEIFITQFHNSHLKPQLNGSELILHDVFIEIEKPYINPDFDFGRLFDYKIQKWSSLVKNYVNKEALNNMCKLVETRETKNQKKYTESMLFSNAHKNGKGCLLSLTFIKRDNERIVSAVLRSSEITKRLMMDLLLIKKIADYVWGTKTQYKLQVIAHNMYQISEFAVVYDIWKPLHRWLLSPDMYEKYKYTQRVLKSLEYLKKVDINTVKYKVHKRTIRQLQTDKKGNPISGNKGLKVKDLKFSKHLQ